MLLKQSLTKTCLCGQAMEFPEGEIRSTCSCGANWELGPEGYWYTQSIITPVAPIVAKPLVVCASKSRNRPERYRNYPKSKNKKKGRKAGSRCC